MTITSSRMRQARAAAYGIGCAILAMRGRDCGARAGLAEPDHHGDRSVRRRQRQRHRRTHRARSGGEAGRPDHRGRQPPGGGTIVGVNAVARAAPDGYTMLVHSSSFSASYSLHKSLPFDMFKDFAAVVPLGYQPTVLVVAASKPWKTLGELVAEAKAKPGALNFASAGVGAASHLAAERFRLERGLQGAAHSVQGTGRGAHRGDDRTHRLLLPAGGAGAEPDPRRQGPRACRQHGEAHRMRCRTCPPPRKRG